MVLKYASCVALSMALPMVYAVDRGQRATLGRGRIRLLAVLLASKPQPEQPLLDVLVPTAAKDPLVRDDGTCEQCGLVNGLAHGIDEGQEADSVIRRRECGHHVPLVILPHLDGMHGIRRLHVLCGCAQAIHRGVIVEGPGGLVFPYSHRQVVLQL